MVDFYKKTSGVIFNKEVVCSRLLGHSHAFFYVNAVQDVFVTVPLAHLTAHSNRQGPLNTVRIKALLFCLINHVRFQLEG